MINNTININLKTLRTKKHIGKKHNQNQYEKNKNNRKQLTTLENNKKQ